MKDTVAEDVVGAFAEARAPMKVAVKDRAKLAKDVSYLRLFARMNVGWKKHGDGAVAPVAVGLVDFSQLPAGWFEKDSYQPKAMEALFELFRETLKRCKVKVTSYFIAGGYFELSLARAEVAKLERVVALHQTFAGTTPPYLGAVPDDWKPWADAALKKYDEVMAVTKRLAPKSTGAKAAPEKAPAKKPAKAAAAPAKQTAKPSASPRNPAAVPLGGDVPASFRTSFSQDLGWWLTRDGDRLPFRANTKGVFFAQTGETLGFDLRTVADPKKHVIMRPPGFIVDGASANERLGDLVSRCDACGSHALSLVDADGQVQVVCTCGGMFEYTVFLASKLATIEWAARLEGKWKPGDEEALVTLAPAMLSAGGKQATAAARRVASSLSLRAYAPGESADDALAELGAQPRLRHLHLWYSGLTDAGLAHFAKYETLTHVNAGNNKGVTDASAATFAKLRALKSLELEQTAVGDELLAVVAKLPSLEYLVLNSTRITDSGLAALRKHPSLREIRIGWSKITDDGLRHLATIPKLESVSSWDSKNAAKKASLGRAELQAL